MRADSRQDRCRRSTVVERDYPNIYKRFTALGPLMTSSATAVKGIAWNTEHEVDLLKASQWRGDRGRTRPRGWRKSTPTSTPPKSFSTLAPETNGEVAVKAWDALSKTTGREHAHLAMPKEDEKIRFRDIVAQPRKIISAPTWSGLE